MNGESRGESNVNQSFTKTGMTLHENAVGPSSSLSFNFVGNSMCFRFLPGTVFQAHVALKTSVRWHCWGFSSNRNLGLYTVNILYRRDLPRYPNVHNNGNANATELQHCISCGTQLASLINAKGIATFCTFLELLHPKMQEILSQAMYTFYINN